MKKATRTQSPETLSGSSQHLIHSSSFHENSHTCVHTYTETHRNMQVHTQTHTHIQTDTGTQIHARTHTDRQMQAHTYTDKYTYTHLNKKLNYKNLMLNNKYIWNAVQWFIYFPLQMLSFPDVITLEPHLSQSECPYIEKYTSGLFSPDV